jgi:sugar diacid utilization regulator
MMREAVIQARASLEAMRQGLQQTEQRLAHERRQLADAERRGRLAAGIQDAETVEVAERFAAKHHERVEVLERKLDAQRRELTLAEREYEEMKAQLIVAERERPATDAARSVESAWRDLEAAGGTRPETDVKDELLRSQLDRSAREARADEQLQELKRKMGKP